MSASENLKPGTCDQRERAKGKGAAPLPPLALAPQGSAPALRVGWITAVAVAVYIGFRVLPTGTNLSHTDFQVQGENTLEMCDPGNPQFLPVVNVRSPVSLTLVPGAAPQAGQPLYATLTLKTYAGKAIGPADLLRSHTELVHLMIVDPDLMDYHHVHPQPIEGSPGQWQFGFTPRYGGQYRVFADFTPAATGLGLYASAQIDVAGEPPSEASRRAAQVPSWHTALAGVDFELRPVAEAGKQAAPEGEVRARRQITMRLELSRPDGGPVSLEPIMDAFAHVVAFDIGRTGFAHLHPQEVDLSVPPDAHKPALTFRVLIPNPGRYVAWAQVNQAGTERFAPFWFDVK
ncbi:hypothetical protein AXK11_08305 [Cephaloticoccus primus]|uniref:YtkA-like domain-containing protein n=1 Tax=Cephaloticoccus primus TaxID=1548207 RepID=A0A139SJ14_9BACT|nr:hypothetical protein [Cephaloticoccus primus]KXU34484.1 hypothetical protein AXK11_08305 [Cephaloticoccus primus]